MVLEEQMPEPILLDDAGAANHLSISIDDIEWLAATRQLQPITICGKRRFLYQNLCDLAKVYKSTQQRT